MDNLALPMLANLIRKYRKDGHLLDELILKFKYIHN